METVIVLAMHGAPPNDYPQEALLEFFGLHAQLEHAPPDQQADLRSCHEALEAHMRSWPRTPANDPFWAASHDLGSQLSQSTGAEVLVGFNEFCSPSVDEALDAAALRGPGRIIVVTPMLTRGGEHAEQDIPAAIEDARSRHPAVPIVYAWPPGVDEVARFLAAQIARVEQKGDKRG
jgi:sirohydrochlorin cobaltochelatase